MSEVLLDAREIQPRERHPRIFATFDQLPVGSSFILANDHDPRPLYYQFDVEREGAFRWTYLEEGPDLWRVRITKTAEVAAAPVDGCCGGGCGD